MPFKLKFYSLMYISAKESDGAYLQKMEQKKRIEIYLKMALRLAKGVKARFNLPLTLVTNDQTNLTAIFNEFAGNDWANYLILIQIDFATSIPNGARYFSATHKVMLFDYFANQTEYSILLDLDMVCLEGVSSTFSQLIRDEVPLVYDISDQVFPAHGYSRIYDDMKKFGPIGKEFRWYGGEFIGGNPVFFRELSKLVMLTLPRYQEVFTSLHHQGDEMLTSYCLNSMRESGSENVVVDMGGLDSVRRHHAKATLHDERRFGNIKNIVFLHLPTIKSLLASRYTDKSIIATKVGWIFPCSYCQSGLRLRHIIC